MKSAQLKTVASPQMQCDKERNPREAKRNSREGALLRLLQWEPYALLQLLLETLLLLVIRVSGVLLLRLHRLPVLYHRN
jgi:hypothetical protein